MLSEYILFPPCGKIPTGWNFSFRQMKPSLLSIPLCMLLAACSGKQAQNSENTDICALWRIDTIAVNDTTVFSPEALPTVLFDNSGAYVIQTNCNTIAGAFTINGDSLRIDGGMRTEMACDDMRAEDLIVAVLPEINLVETTGEHSLRLSTDNPDCYLILSKAAE